MLNSLESITFMRFERLDQERIVIYGEWGRVKGRPETPICRR
jgi:hypothetical protein